MMCINMYQMCINMYQMFEMACTKLSNFLEIVEEETVLFDGNKCHCLDFSESSNWCVYMKHFS